MRAERTVLRAVVYRGGKRKMEYCIGIDLGGTNIAGGVATLDGRLVHTG